jgi:hypothetical protein
VKKVISIGVALALLAMVIVPATVGAAAPEPETYAKIPFAIIGQAFYMLQDVLTQLQVGGILPPDFDWVPDLMPTLGDFVAVPLSWTVDMTGWGISLGGSVLASLQGVFDAMGIDLGFNLGAFQDVFDTIACALFQPWAPVSGTPFDPCA